jgi:adenylate cyclase
MEKKTATTKKATARKGTSEQRMVQAEMLLDVSRKVAAIDSLDEVLGVLMEMSTWELGAERSSLFLNDPQSGELYSRFAQGNFQREIRIINDSGIAGSVFQSGKGRIIHDAYKDKSFNSSVDERTGYTTRNMICVPIKTVKDEVIGVAQVLNKKKGRFTKEDLALLEAITTQASIALQSTQFVEKMIKTREKEMEFLDVVSEVTSEIDLDTMLAKVMLEATRMLQADRSTLFLSDEKTDELFSRIAMGDSIGEIRLPNHLGIAGAVFTSGKTVNIPFAYADLRFNPAFDKKTGYFTRSILCVPIINKDGKTIGVVQTLNRRGGPFTDEDEQRLKAFTGQVAIGLENAKLFDDTQNLKNYNESMLESMTNAVITTDEDGKIITCNAAGAKIFRISTEVILGQKVEDFFVGTNAWIMEYITKVDETLESDLVMDADIEVGNDEDENKEKMSANVTFLPLVNAEQKKLGSLVMVEDISTEKRMKSTMSRYMDPALADQMMSGSGEADMMGGLDTVATVLFSDIRSFTTITETLGAQGTVEFLNEYFEIMVDCITLEGGMLDKFIGDAIMAAFGIPMQHDDDEDRGLRAAISMMTRLNDYNVTRVKKGLMAVDHGMGLNTGKIVAGNIGSKKRMDYTMIGDGVNLAARLESACKQYSAHILISEYTVANLKGTYRTRYIDDVVVKGKTKPVGVYEVLDYHTDETFPNLMDNVNYFNEGRRHYRDGNWDKAIKSFQEALKGNPNDKLANTYIEERCKYLKKQNPKDWDGVWVMTSK